MRKFEVANNKKRSGAHFGDEFGKVVNNLSNKFPTSSSHYAVNSLNKFLCNYMIKSEPAAPTMSNKK